MFHVVQNERRDKTSLLVTMCHVLPLLLLAMAPLLNFSVPLNMH